MTTNDYLKQVEEEFEEEFLGVYYGKDNDGQPIYPTLELLKAQKLFLRQKIAEAVEMAKKGEI